MTNDEDKLKTLQAQIDALKAKTEPAKGDGTTADSRAMSVGMRAGTELVGATVGAALIGYGLDRWLGTKPWLLIVMLLLGIGAGFLNIWKLTQNQDAPPSEKKIQDN
ncbi:MAG: AtpZ/AtpI family protein [Proteobacteria bacterium]|nr:AtpZ/AtpI family protein [Pseudomonadota bacterium]